MAFSLHTCAQVVQLQAVKKRILTNVAGREWQEVDHCGARTTFAFFLAVLNYSGSAHKSQKRAKNAREKGEREREPAPTALLCSPLPLFSDN